MADSDYLDYRLRCHTKRTDLPVDVLRDIGEAYAEIMRLQRERDEARRMVCITLYTDKEMQRNHARLCGWDCFKDYDKANEALDRLAELDQELGLFDMPQTNE